LANQKQEAVMASDGYVYKNQALQLTLNVGVDLTAESGNVRIDIRSPSGVESSVTPVILSPATDGLIQYDIPADTLNESGEWLFKSFLIAQQTPGQQFVLSVLDMWSSTGIPTVHEIREYLSGYCTEEVDSRWVRGRRDAVVSWMEARLGVSLTGVREYTDLVSGSGTPIIWVTRRPIIDFVSINYVRGQGELSPSKESLEVVYDEGIIRARTQSDRNRDRFWVFPSGTYNIKVTYTAGYDDIPAALREAIMALTCEKLLGQLAARDGGGTSINVSGFGQNFGQRGRYTEARDDLARWGIDLMRQYMTGVIKK
jgi:hypothetical protein